MACRPLNETVAQGNINLFVFFWAVVRCGRGETRGSVRPRGRVGVLLLLKCDRSTSDIPGYIGSESLFEAGITKPMSEVPTAVLQLCTLVVLQRLIVIDYNKQCRFFGLFSKSF